MSDGEGAASPPIRVEIRGLMLDPASNNPIVILRDPESESFLPIWIGLFEASAIQLGLQEVESPRPRTHDLLASFLAALGGRLLKVVVEDLREQTFYAVLHVERVNDGREQEHRQLLEIDARPSDAIALAIRTGAPIFVQPDVLERAQVAESGSKEERARELLEQLDDEDLGKYEM
jgi:hypothetical protein